LLNYRLKYKIPQIVTLTLAPHQQTNELRGVEKKNGESFSTFSASVPRPAFEIIKVGEMRVKRKAQKNTAIQLYFKHLQLD